MGLSNTNKEESVEEIESEAAAEKDQKQNENRSIVSRITDAGSDALRSLMNGLGYESNECYIPQPSGPYRVGCADLMISDMEVAPCGYKWYDYTKGVFVRFYYPCDRSAVSPTGELNFSMWPSKEYFYGYADIFKIWHAPYDAIFKRVIGDIRVPYLWHGPLAEKSDSNQSGFPVILFSHGLGASRFLNSVTCANWASCGYIVASIEHRDRTSYYTYDIGSDGTVHPIRYWGVHPRRILSEPQTLKRGFECEATWRLMKLLNEGPFPGGLPKGEQSCRLGKEFDWTSFKGRIDTDKAILSGHSYGASTTFTSSLLMPDVFKCIVILDGWMEPVKNTEINSVDIPILFLNSSRWQWKENVDKMFRMMHSDKEHSRDMLMLTIMGTVHNSFADVSFGVTGTLGRLSRWSGTLDRFLCAQIVKDVTIAFIKKYTAEPDAVSLNHLQQQYKRDLIWGTNVSMVFPNSVYHDGYHASDVFSRLFPHMGF